MKKKLLVTDSFFVKTNDIHQLEIAGFEVIHLDKVCASEEELIEAIHDVSVYILGGTELVTDTIVNSANKLEAIIFTGVDYDNFIPAAELAQQKGIKLLNAPGANATAVGEFAIGMALLMLRELLDIGRTGTKKEVTTSTFQNSTVGILGMGNIGQVICKSVEQFSPKEVIYYNRSSKATKAKQATLTEIVEVADVIFITLPKKAGLILDNTMISKLKKGCLIVSISPNNLIDFQSLLVRLKSGEVRCAVDWEAPNKDFEELPLNIWYNVNSHSGFNTEPAIEEVGKSVVQKAISLL